MGRHQYKNLFNDWKRSMVTPEPINNKTGRCDHSNPEEAEINNFKCNFLGMMEKFEKEI